jgi:hypothetical protein
MIRFVSFHESLTLRGCLCVTFLCGRVGEEHGRKLYLSLCNREWLKVVRILVSLCDVCSTWSVIKEGIVAHIKCIQNFVTFMY